MNSPSQVITAPLYVNLDRLYQGIMPISFAVASSHLVYTLGKKLGLDRAQLKSLKVSIENLLSDSSLNFSAITLLSAGHPEFRLLILSSAQKASTHVVLDTGNSLIDLDEQLQAQSSCSSLGLRTYSIKLSDTHFSGLTRLSNEGSHLVSAEGALTLGCVGTKGTQPVYLNGGYTLSFPVQIKKEASGNKALSAQIPQLLFQAADLH